LLDNAVFPYKNSLGFGFLYFKSVSDNAMKNKLDERHKSKLWVRTFAEILPAKNSYLLAKRNTTLEPFNLFFPPFLNTKAI